MRNVYYVGKGVANAREKSSTLDFDMNLDWNQVMMETKLGESILRVFSNRVDWSIVSKYQESSLYM